MPTGLNHITPTVEDDLSEINNASEGMHMSGAPWPTKDEIRLQGHRQILDQELDFSLGDVDACPLPVALLAQLQPDSPGVHACLSSGLTAVVYQLRVEGRAYAVKCARRPSLVRNDAGQTSFVNELQRHAEISALRAQGAVFTGVVEPLYGSLQHGLVVSPWIDAEPVTSFDRRQLTQLFSTGRSLIEAGFFEWDFCPGNVLDDGQQTWLFDFGYMYRFDPLTEFNSAGHGTDHSTYHLAERLETRNLFYWLLGIENTQGREAALDAFAMVKEVAVETYTLLHTNLAHRQATPQVLNWIQGHTNRWREALAGDLGGLYLAEGWRSHSEDLASDLSGKSCTHRSLERTDWLIGTARQSHAALQSSGCLTAQDAVLSQDALLAAYQARRAMAVEYQLGAH